MIKVTEKTETNQDDDAMIQLEECLTICGFGRFQYKVMAAIIIGCISTTMMNLTTSFILPNAECDLNMNLVQKGWLNAAPSIGTVSVGFFAGIISDTFGRQPCLLYSSILALLLRLIKGFSQNYWVFLTVKLLQGIPSSFAFATMAAYLSELLPKISRDICLIIYASLIPVTLIFTTLSAWIVLPKSWLLIVWDNKIELKSWNIYVLACAIWPLLSAILYSFLPESPKYLLVQGKTKEALYVLEGIYRENTGKGDFPFSLMIKSFELLNSNHRKIKFTEKLKSALYTLKRVLKAKLILRTAIICICSFLCSAITLSLKLWFPQISTIMENYKLDYGESSHFCTMIDDYLNKTENLATEDGFLYDEECVPKTSGSETYQNSLLIGIFPFIFVLLNSTIVNLFGQKRLLFASIILSAILTNILFLTIYSPLQVAVIMSSVVGCQQAVGSLLNNVAVRTFPTEARSTLMSLYNMFTAAGTLPATVVFAVLLEKGCRTPFYAMFGCCCVMAILVFFLPNIQKENRKTDK